LEKEGKLDTLPEIVKIRNENLRFLNRNAPKPRYKVGPEVERKGKMTDGEKQEILEKMKKAADDMEKERKLKAKKHREELIQEKEDAANRAAKTDEDSALFLAKMGKEGYVGNTDTLEARLGRTATRRQRGLDNDLNTAKFV